MLFAVMRRCASTSYKRGGYITHTDPVAKPFVNCATHASTAQLTGQDAGRGLGDRCGVGGEAAAAAERRRQVLLAVETVRSQRRWSPGDDALHAHSVQSVSAAEVGHGCTLTFIPADHAHSVSRLLCRHDPKHS